MTASSGWQIEGDYFENCNCDVVCPCLFSSAPPFTSQPTQGACEVAFGFHIDRGHYQGVSLDGLNAAAIVRTPGPMGQGNWSFAAYLDERATDEQRAALQAIFTGAAGGPIALLTPLVSTILGVKTAPITYRREGKRRSMEIPSVLSMGVQPAPSFDPDHEIWAENAHPFASKVAFAVGTSGSTFSDYGMTWDNSGKNGHYAPISWSG
ncbi:DUF1326 domain-containing protein [Sphaerobacter sp.]|uniref:DUF1326 domain-containing protein n=1 Tax=Sphaerobacter sp. TaxID=2099654 RepID=UPI001DAC5C85|nr:DUF1326 domain-containing protein [Sphaerobacter sp.]MBX5444755.1 DUF1326 domain-containing protein [Sphaerobacter sp.]